MMWQAGVLAFVLLTLYAPTETAGEPSVRELWQSQVNSIQEYQHFLEQLRHIVQAMGKSVQNARGTCDEACVRLLSAEIGGAVQQVLQSRVSGYAGSLAGHGDTGNRACVNVWDDECANSGIPGTGEDDGNFGGGGPGKRSVWAAAHPCAAGLQLPACRVWMLRRRLLQV